SSCVAGHRLEWLTSVYAPPFTRRPTPELPKQACEMRLIAHPTLLGNLTKGMVGRQHHLLCSLDAQPCDIGERRLAECFLESAKEVSGTQPSKRNKIRTSDRLREIFLDKSCQALRLPRGQPATKCVLGFRSDIPFQTGGQQRRRTGQ